VRIEHKILVGNMKGREHLEDLVVDGRVGLECANWIHLAKDRDQ
jgi:hypothetical protein